MHKFLHVATALFLAMLPAPFLARSCLAAPTAAPQVSARLSPYLARAVTIDATIDGHPARLMLDTGGSTTAITPQFAGKIGCNPYGELSGFRMRGERVRTKKCGERLVRLGRYAANVDVLEADFMRILPPDAPPIDGVLALNAFDGQAVTLDLTDARLVVETPASLEVRTAGLPVGRVRLMREMGGIGLTAFAKVAAEKGTLWFLLDSGNMAEVVVSPGALEQWGIPAQAAKSALSEPSVPANLRVDGAPSAPPKVSVRDIIYDGVLSERFLHEYDVTLDLKNGRAWYRPRGVKEQAISRH
jgi:hypothetical protein